MRVRTSNASCLCGLALVAILLASIPAQSSSVLPLTTDQHIDIADAICRGVVVEVECYKSPKDAGIYTRSLIRVDEALKGKFPAVIKVIHRGGFVGNEGEQDGFAPVFRVGEERLLFLSRRADGTLFATQGGPSAIKLERESVIKDRTGPFVERHQRLLERIRQRIPKPSALGADVTDQSVRRFPRVILSPPSPDVEIAAVTGLLTTNGVSSRFIAPDRGEPIPYIVDAQALPAGITLAQATGAVHNAIQAWANVTSLQFKFEGLQNFEQAANTVTNLDGKLRIQLHDLHGAIAGPTVLGIGGRAVARDEVNFPGGALGGRVGANEFHLSARGFVVLKHTHMSMQTLSTFEEVVCHEVGHSISMAHSSENAGETNEFLRQSIMFFQAHMDGRGAMLGAYDPPVIQQAHPLGNLPPYGYDRMMYVVHTDVPLADPQVNQIEVKGYDLHGDALTKALFNATSGFGMFSMAGDTLTFTPAPGLPASDSPLLDPAGIGAWDQVHVRFDDGTNRSPPMLVRVLQFQYDSRPAIAPDGLPDSWMMANFGTITPVAGVSGPNDDPDGDNLTNFHELKSATNPNDANSSFRILSFGSTNLQWSGRPFELYEVEASTNLTNYNRFRNPIVPRTTTGSVPEFVTSPVTSQTFRVKKVR